MNEDELTAALREEAGAAVPTDAIWWGIVEEAERRRRRPASLRRARMVAAAAAVLALAAAGITAVGSSGDPEELATVRAGVPSVTGGSSDLIVESGTFTDEGGRGAVPEVVAGDVSLVEGVEVVTGVVRAFARLAPGGSTTFTPSVVVSWDGGDGFEIASGRAPEAEGEVALTALAAERLGVAAGDELRTDAGATLAVVGTFALPGDGPDVVLAAVELGQARLLAGQDGFSRLHVSLSEDADVDAVRDAVVAAVPGGYRVVGVNQLGTTAQLRDELEIQQSYFDLMHPDSAVRTAAVEGAVDTEETRANYERLRDQAAQGTLRIQRFVFLDTDHVEVVYAIYYGTGRSPIVPEPQTGRAVRLDGRWKLARTTVCELAGFVDEPCFVGGAEPPTPPAGWDEPSAEPGAVAAFRVLADPRSSLEERLAVVPGADREVVRAGLVHDQRYAGAVAFHVSGVRGDGDEVEVLYAVQAPGEPPLETPYPLVGRARRVDGRWVVDPLLACGLAGLVHQGCPAPESTTTTSTTGEVPGDNVTTTTEAVPGPSTSTETTADPTPEAASVGRTPDPLH